jgi:hypothetical protein
MPWHVCAARILIAPSLASLSLFTGEPQQSVLTVCIPMLAGRLAVSSSEGLDAMVQKIMAVIDD